MRALATRLIKRELFSITKPPPRLKSLSLSVAAHGEGDTKKKKKKKASSACNSHILGPDLPDVWTPRDASSSLSSSQNQIQGISFDWFLVVSFSRTRDGQPNSVPWIWREIENLPTK